MSSQTVSGVESGKAAIYLKDLHFRWRPTTPLVLEIDELSVASGESVFLVGPSGSGKSSLLNLLGGVTEPLDGELRVLGEDLTELSMGARDHLRGDHMGFIFQQFNLIPFLSVIENVTLPCEFSAHRRERVLERAPSLRDEAIRILKGLKLHVDQILNKPVTQLSVGQQQRVAAARALIGRPSLVIADEPTSALDADARESFLKVLFDECREARATLVFVSHDRSLGKHFDRQVDLTQINKAFRPVDL